MPPEFIPIDGEEVLARPRPSAWMILLDALGMLLPLGALLLGGVLLWALDVHRPIGRVAVVVCIIAIAAVVAWRCLDVMARDYILTSRRVVVRRGVLNRSVAEAPLSAVRDTLLLRPLAQRLVGIGTIGFSTAGGPGYEVAWRMVRGPNAELARVRRILASREGAPRADNDPVPRPSATARAPRLLVIGLAGGIGAGKSAAAAAFASLGCIVIDSDARARAALDRPEVKHTLVSWWGSEILDADGRVDRARIAAIVFADPAQRRRLEELVHPIVRQDRAAIIREVKQSPRPDPPAAPLPPAVIIDAPLLFEAGLDAECDAVVFIDAPRADRAARVKRTRGWDEAELARREAAQWPPEKKRSLCRFVLNNPDPPSDLVPGARAILLELGNPAAAGGESSA